MNAKYISSLRDKKYKRIPVVREVLADLDTPLSTYLKLANGPNSYFFESLEGGEKWARYSIIGLPCNTVISITGNDVTIKKDNKVVKSQSVSDPLEWINEYREKNEVKAVPGLPRFTGGLVGYFGYEITGCIEPVLENSFKININDSLNTPDILLMVSDDVVVFDNLSGKLYVVTNAETDVESSYAAAEGRLDEIIYKLKTTTLNYAETTKPTKKIDETDFVTKFGRENYLSAINRIKEYILDGDVMQVVLSQRLSIPCESNPLNVYRALRSLNPSPYMYFLNLDEFNIIGSSPEILSRLEDDSVTVRPIAGTRPRGSTEEEDEKLEEDLLKDPKELAEHLMLIDLGRNDIGRVTDIGSVEVTEKMNIERYSHVMHIVSNITGKVKADTNSIDVLKATFPAGTVSGAPKIRAMEIINELEPSKRGIYSGAIGYISWTGNMDTAIAIRTAIIKNKILYIQVGAGIVADSVAEKEWDETMSKGRAIFCAVAMAEAGI
jgi:anthranilate synthase component I